jgi:azurin
MGVRVRSLYLVFGALALCSAPAVPAMAQPKQPATPAASKPAAGVARVVEIKGTDDMKYSVTRIDAKPGEQITVKLTGVGSMPKMVMAHNFVLLKKGTDEKAFTDAAALARDTGFIAPAQKVHVIAATPLAGAGETVQVSFAAPKVAGTYTYLCSFPGHSAAGMKGTLTVQ